VQHFTATLQRLPRLVDSLAMLAALNADINRGGEVGRCMERAFGAGAVRDASLFHASASA
jgi:hypothetical protein